MNLRQWAKATHHALMEHRVQGSNSLTPAQVERTLQMGISTLINALVEGDELRLDGFGRLWVEEKPARRLVGNLPGQQRTYKVKARKVVRFRASSQLAMSLREYQRPPSAEEADSGAGKSPSTTT